MTVHEEESRYRIYLATSANQYCDVVVAKQFFHSPTFIIILNLLLIIVSVNTRRFRKYWS